MRNTIGTAAVAVHRALGFGGLSGGTQAFRALAFAASVLGAGCHFVTEFDKDRITTAEYRTYVLDPETDLEGLDLLVVLDTTDPTRVEDLRWALTEWLTTLAGAQSGFDYGTQPLGGPVEVGLGTPPLLHVGFVTSDMGLGFDPGQDLTVIEGCTPYGDDGRLVYPANTGTWCDDFMQTFMVIQQVDVVNHPGDTAGNRPTIEDAVNCFMDAALERSSTCPFMQPLAAVDAALVDTFELRPENIGFARPNAALAVVIGAHVDDCSVFDPYVFDPSGPYAETFTPFWCFENGVACDQPILAAPGVKTGCGDLSDDTVLCDPEQAFDSGLRMMPAFCYAERLKRQKSPMPVLVAVASGSTDHVEVVLDANNQPALLHTANCGDQNKSFPAIRLQAFADAFLYNGFYHSLCDDDMTATILQFAVAYENSALKRCIDDEVVDTVPDTPLFVDADCRVQVINNPGGPDEQLGDDVTPCDANRDQESLTVDQPSCWEVQRSSACTSGNILYIIQPALITANAEAPMADRKWFQARCLVRKQ